MPKRGRYYLNQSVSFPPDLLTAAKRRAQSLGLSFSTYVQKCVERDLAERGPIVFREYVDPPPLAVAESARPGFEESRTRRGRKP